MLSRMMMAAASGPTDPDFDKVKWLMHMNGADASPTFTDSSSDARTVTAEGTAQLDTAQKQFGSASGLFDGDSDRATVAFSDGDGDLDPNAQDFTVEMWVRRNSDTTQDTAFSNLDGVGANGWFLEIRDTDVVRVNFPTAGAVNNLVSSVGTITAGSWHHIAWCRQSGTQRIYIDGTQDGTGSISGALFIPAGVTKLAIGAHATLGGGWYDGWIDEFRYTLALCRYPDGTSFTPAGPFPDA